MLAPDSPPVPARLTLASPEELGVAAARPAVPETAPASADWNSARDRLNRLSAVGFQLNKLDQGGFRVTCFLPSGQPGRTHCVEAIAASEGAAVAEALQRAEQWAVRK
jgi:hypothetical protein